MCDTIVKSLPCTFQSLQSVFEQCPHENLAKFSTTVTFDMFKGQDSEKLLKDYVNNCFMDRFNIFGEIPQKFLLYIETMKKGFPMDDVVFSDLFINEEENKIWVVADKVNSSISDRFFEIAQKIWDKMFIDVDVVLLGENEIKRDLIPSCFKHIELKNTIFYSYSSVLEKGFCFKGGKVVRAFYYTKAKEIWLILDKIDFMTRRNLTEKALNTWDTYCGEVMPVVTSVDRFDEAKMPAGAIEIKVG